VLEGWFCIGVRAAGAGREGCDGVVDFLLLAPYEGGGTNDGSSGGNSRSSSSISAQLVGWCDMVETLKTAAVIEQSGEKENNSRSGVKIQNFMSHYVILCHVIFGALSTRNDFFISIIVWHITRPAYGAGWFPE
jgi:hypothetical protein